MQFDSPFGLTELRPVKEAQAEFDNGRVQTKELVFKTETFVGRQALG